MVSRRIRLVGLVGGMVLALSAGVWGAFEYFNEEPARYGLLVFGPEAETRVWLVVQGETLEIHRDGKLTGRGERVGIGRNRARKWKDIEIEASDDKTEYIITGVSLIQAEPEQKRGASLIVNVDVQRAKPYRQYCDLELKEDPEEVTAAHFDGPLKIEIRKIFGEIPEGTALKKGDKPTRLSAVIGTFDHKKGCWVVVRTEKGDSSAFPEGVFPRAEIEFPAKNSGQPPLKREYTLDHFC